MKEQKREDEEKSFEYYIEVGEDGKLYGVTEYPTLITVWEITSTIEIDNEIYFIST